MSIQQGQLTRGALKCPGCRKYLSGWTGTGTKPAAGDISVCLYCQVLLRFGPGLLCYDLATPEFIASLDEETMAYLKNIQVTLKKRPNGDT